MTNRVSQTHGTRTRCPHRLRSEKTEVRREGIRVRKYYRGLHVNPALLVLCMLHEVRGADNTWRVAHSLVWVAQNNSAVQVHTWCPRNLDRLLCTPKIELTFLFLGRCRFPLSIFEPFCISSIELHDQGEDASRRCIVNLRRSVMSALTLSDCNVVVVSW